MRDNNMTKIEPVLARDIKAGDTLSFTFIVDGIKKSMYAKVRSVKPNANSKAHVNLYYFKDEKKSTKVWVLRTYYRVIEN